MAASKRQRLLCFCITTEFETGHKKRKKPCPKCRPRACKRHNTRRKKTGARRTRRNRRPKPLLFPWGQGVSHGAIQLPPNISLPNNSQTSTSQTSTSQTSTSRPNTSQPNTSQSNTSRPNDPQPDDPPQPQPSQQPILFMQECCGQVMLTGSSQAALIWERDPSANVQLVQVTVHCSLDSPEPLRVLIENDGGQSSGAPSPQEFLVLPGNTWNYSGRQPKRLQVQAVQTQGGDAGRNNPSGSAMYVEGTYAVRPTFLLTAQPLPSA